MSTATYDPNGLFAGDGPIITQPVTILSGQNMTRGAVLGKVTASGKYILSLAAANDGSQTPVGVLAIDCDATGGDKDAAVYFSGEFNAAKLTFGTGHTAATVNAALRAAAAPIFVRVLP